jgi:hypothetical protein
MNRRVAGHVLVQCSPESYGLDSESGVDAARDELAVDVCVDRQGAQPLARAEGMTPLTIQFGTRRIRLALNVAGTR